MKRERCEESSVWPNKKATAPSTTANAQWPDISTSQTSSLRDNHSLLLGNAASGIEESAIAIESMAVSPSRPEGSAFTESQPRNAQSPQGVRRQPQLVEHASHPVRQHGKSQTQQEKNLQLQAEGSELDQKPAHVPKKAMETRAEKLPALRYIPSALSVMVEEEDELNDLKFVSDVFTVVSIASFAVWLTLLVVAFWVTPPQHVMHVEKSEQLVAVVAACLIALALFTKVAPIVITHGRRSVSGILVGSIAVQVIALSTNLIMAFCSVPILIDPVTGARVFLLRWCEWTPLAFAMTFFTEGMDVVRKRVPHNYPSDIKSRILWYWRILKVPISLASSQMASTFMGFVFPFCPGVMSWTVAMVFSCILFLGLFPRLLSRRKEARNIEDKELHERITLTYRLLLTCSICWCLLVVSYFTGALGPVVAPEHSFWANPSLPFFCDATIDVVAKAFYMDVIVDVHNVMFDGQARSTRRLEELRRMMAVVWDCSSDVIVLSVKGLNGTVTTMISPTFHKIEHLLNHHDATAPIVFEMKATDLKENATKDILEATDIYFLDTVSAGNHVSPRKESVHPAYYPGFLSIRNLIREGWAISSEEETIHHSIVSRNRSVIECETKATRLGSHALVLVMRDISERHMRFEAEKTAISESTAREKDAEANRFTRHEVKNGLLASIGLCDSLREAIAEQTGRPIDRTTSENLSSLRLMSLLESNKKEKWRDPQALKRNAPGQDGVQALMKDLDLTLRNILDTVLSEAMARDVIHEVYRPKLERVDLRSVLSGGGNSSVTNRFPFVTDPSPLPPFLFDLQLLKFIHGNAVSNACKYGKKGGVVLTEVRHLQDTDEILMDVINLPGKNHASILAMGQAAADGVFAASNRLQLNNNSLSETSASHSSGDGAWISQKCARTLGGICSIRFEPSRTVFSLRCPATTYDAALGVPSNFRLPDNTWGVAIDDSKIQRKMLQRFFALAGIPKKHQLLLGNTSDEIRGFAKTVVNLVKSHPKNYFLVIVDENLDITMASHKEHTISGSLTIQKLRQELGPILEQRVLAVVRSANDSAQDIEVYNARAHGFLHKAPISKGKVMEVLGPLWVKRFAERFPDSVDAVNDDHDEAEAQKQESNAELDTTTEDYVAAAFDAMESLEVIDALCMGDDSSLAPRWGLIREKLQELDEELQTLERSQVVEAALAAISAMNGPQIPNEFLSQWATLRALIIRVV